MSYLESQQNKIKIKLPQLRTALINLIDQFNIRSCNDCPSMEKCEILQTKINEANELHRIYTDFITESQVLMKTIDDAENLSSFFEKNIKEIAEVSNLSSPTKTNYDVEDINDPITMRIPAELRNMNEAPLESDDEDMDNLQLRKKLEFL